MLLRDPVTARYSSVGPHKGRQASPLTRQQPTSEICHGVLHHVNSFEVGSLYRTGTEGSLEHAILVGLSPGAEPSLQAHTCRIHSSGNALFL